MADADAVARRVPAGPNGDPDGARGRRDAGRGAPAIRDDLAGARPRRPDGGPDARAACRRAASLRSQFIMDVHTHYLRDDTRHMGFVEMRKAVGRAGWNPALNPAEQSIESLKYANWFKEWDAAEAA